MTRVIGMDQPSQRERTEYARVGQQRDQAALDVAFDDASRYVIGLALQGKLGRLDKVVPIVAVSAIEHDLGEPLLPGEVAELEAALRAAYQLGPAVGPEDL